MPPATAKGSATDNSAASAENAGLEDEYCGTTYAAKLLGLSVATVQSLVEKGEIEAWKTRGGHRRISMQSINRYLLRYSPQAGGIAPDLRQRLHVLVVDDDEPTRELYKAYFDEWNLPVECTLMSSALEALIDISGLRPDLLIADLNMTGVDGLEMLKVLKRTQQLSGMQVLVVSGLDREAVASRGGLPEDAMFLKKPVNFEWLHGYVSALLGGKRRA